MNSPIMNDSKSLSFKSVRMTSRFVHFGRVPLNVLQKGKMSEAIYFWDRYRSAVVGVNKPSS